MPLKIQLGAEITGLASADVGRKEGYEEACPKYSNNTSASRVGVQDGGDASSSHKSGMPTYSSLSSSLCSLLSQLASKSWIKSQSEAADPGGERL